ncbi:MAG TPA: Co2+/Mg2+ efflux protein ApaG [Bacteroidia bacterium]|nr:Co2+/Mg2+ efflux protein ApaG [Bacteroidia bacterium]
MQTLVTHGIKICVESTYQDLYSRPEQGHYYFSYRIRIENNSSATVQLMRRHWYIFDSCGEHSEVEGEGVVGQQPVLRPGESYEYESACHLTTEIGSMHGTYEFVHVDDKRSFEVIIPRFLLIAGHRLN